LGHTCSTVDFQHGIANDFVFDDRILVLLTANEINFPWLDERFIGLRENVMVSGIGPHLDSKLAVRRLEPFKVEISLCGYAHERVDLLLFDVAHVLIEHDIVKNNLDQRRWLHIVFTEIIDDFTIAYTKNY
jgi:hypothetical protein